MVRGAIVEKDKCNIVKLCIQKPNGLHDDDIVQHRREAGNDDGGGGSGGGGCVGVLFT